MEVFDTPTVRLYWIQDKYLLLSKGVANCILVQWQTLSWSSIWQSRSFWSCARIGQFMRHAAAVEGKIFLGKCSLFSCSQQSLAFHDLQANPENCLVVSQSFRIIYWHWLHPYKICVIIARTVNRRAGSESSRDYFCIVTTITVDSWQFRNVNSRPSGLTLNRMWQKT